MTSAEPAQRAPGSASELDALEPRVSAELGRLSLLADGLSAAFVQSGETVVRPHPLLLVLRRGSLLVLIAPTSVWDRGQKLLSPYLDALARVEARLILLGEPAERDLRRALNLGLCALLPEEATLAAVQVAAHLAFEMMDVKAQSESLGRSLERYRYEQRELIEIARALTTEREIDKLLSLILEKARFVTGADAGSLYVVEGDEPELARRQLRFKLSQNESVSFDSREFTMPINARSMAGYVALEQKTLRIDDVYAMPAGSQFGFDRSFDEKVSYRTRSMLVTPMVSSKGEVIGVIQLINKKQEPQRKLISAHDFEHGVVPFDERSEELLTTLAAQAGIALENTLLYAEIRNIFEGFVRASVDAIEARDPTTSGHSRRVAELTVGLAHAVERTAVGPYRDLRWKREDLREIEYASLLHDFGKIGVREHVLLKAKKLFPHDVELIRQRFEFVIRTVEADVLERKLQLLSRGAEPAALAELDLEFAATRLEIEEALRVIEQANEPNLLAAGDFKRIEELGRRSYTRLSGDVQTLLSSEEVKSLSVMRGSLTADEFDEIRSHVAHTYRFLSQIPWGKTFAQVAVIAGAHHERLNGTGYPNRWSAERIPVQSKLMSISDIFDALTASDRPYKRAISVERALDILGYEVKDGHIDGELVRIFIEARVWEPVLGASQTQPTV